MNTRQVRFTLVQEKTRSCDLCGGDGFLYFDETTDYEPVPCPACNGEGRLGVHLYAGNGRWLVQCDHCQMSWESNSEIVARQQYRAHVGTCHEWDEIEGDELLEAMPRSLIDWVSEEDREFEQLLVESLGAEEDSPTSYRPGSEYGVFV